MNGMRLVGLLLLALGGYIVWEVLQGQRPQDHIQQLIDLFGHQHVAGQAPAPVFTGTLPQQSSATNLSGRAGGNLAVGP